MKERKENPLEKQSDEELNHQILRIQSEWWNRQGTQAEHKQYKKLMAEVLKRQRVRQNG